MVEENENRVTLKDLTANPAPLGLLGFGLTTVLLNIHNAGFLPDKQYDTRNGHSLWWSGPDTGLLDGIQKR